MVKDIKTEKKFAAKCLTKYHSSLHEAKNCAELKMLQKLEQHPNVLSLFECVFDADKGLLTLIFDLMDMSMYDHIKNRKKALSETKCKFYMFQLVKGLKHLHRHGIFHRDIKPENILIRTDPRMKSINAHKSEIVKIADLGSVCSTDLPLPHSAYISTRWYRAPECLLTSGFYGPKMDVWALGCCFFEILTLNPLFPGENELDQLHKIHEILGSPPDVLMARFKHLNVDLSFPKMKSIAFHKLVPSLSMSGVDILKKTLAYHPELRVSATKLLEHIYFEDLRAKNWATSKSNTATSLTTSLPSSRESTRNNKPRFRMSLNSSRDSLISLDNDRTCAIKRLHDVQKEFNKKLERGWGMNVCPAKTKANGNIKPSLKNH